MSKENYKKQPDYNFKPNKNSVNGKQNILTPENTGTKNLSEYRHKSTKFDLNALRNKNSLEIKNTSEKFPFLSQPQKDLIRYQAPDAYSMIVEMQNQAFFQINKASEIAQKSQLRSSDNAHDTQRSIFHSNKSRDEKRDSYEQNDRKHEREIIFQNQQHSQTLQTIEKTTMIAASVIVVVGVGALLTALLRRD